MGSLKVGTCATVFYKSIPSCHYGYNKERHDRNFTKTDSKLEQKLQEFQNIKKHARWTQSDELLSIYLMTLTMSKLLSAAALVQALITCCLNVATTLPPHSYLHTVVSSLHHSYSDPSTTLSTLSTSRSNWIILMV